MIASDQEFFSLTSERNEEPWKADGNSNPIGEEILLASRFAFIFYDTPDSNGGPCTPRISYSWDCISSSNGSQPSSGSPSGLVPEAGGVQSCSTICGDGVTAGEEECDGGDGCSPECTALAGYSCVINYLSGSAHSSQCDPVCGDGMRLGNEECDDGNKVDLDG
jgi:cysteine-rich repeat protein